MATQPTAIPKLFIGMDIHKKSWAVHLRTDISDHKTLSIPADCEILYDYVRKNFPQHQVSLTYEAGCCGFHPARHFINYGWEVVVVNPADVPRMNKQNFQKPTKLIAEISPNNYMQINSGLFIFLLRTKICSKARSDKEQKLVNSSDLSKITLRVYCFITVLRFRNSLTTLIGAMILLHGYRIFNGHYPLENYVLTANYDYIRLSKQSTCN